MLVVRSALCLFPAMLVCCSTWKPDWQCEANTPVLAVGSAGRMSNLTDSAAAFFAAPGINMKHHHDFQLPQPVALPASCSKAFLKGK